MTPIQEPVDSNMDTALPVSDRSPASGFRLPENLENVSVSHINLYVKSHRMEIVLKAGRLLPPDEIAGLESFFNDCGILPNSDILLNINICIKYDLASDIPPGEIIKKYRETAIYLVNRKTALSKGILAGSEWELADRRLVITLAGNGAGILEAQGCDRFIEDMLMESFSLKTRVEFKDSGIDEVVRDEYMGFKEVEEGKAFVAAAVRQQSDKKVRKQGKRGGNDAQDQPQAQAGEIIVGKRFNDSNMAISEITQDSGKVAFCGDITRVEFREIRGDRYICIFDVTDYTSSLTVKLFIEKNDYDYMTGSICEGKTCRIRGEAQYDKYSKELTVLATDIFEVEKEKRLDDAEVKRVELHLHTQMSSMDAVTPVRHLVERAIAWGHKAIAITDHGVVQAYPEAYEASKGKNGPKIKIIYGMECYLVDDEPPIVYNPGGQASDCVYTVLDIETTGLYADKDRITEIGAVKMHEGRIIEEYSTFINPGVRIPKNITELTGISDEMVKDAPSFEEALPGFLEFIEGTVLAAHNSPFDMGFIRHNASLCGRSIPNPVVDTLQFCRKAIPGLKAYKLGVVASHLGIDMKRHHRALGDARATADILHKCIMLAREKGASGLDSLQDVFPDPALNPKARLYHAVILARNAAGLKNLYKIVSLSHLKYFHKKPRVPKHLFSAFREGLLLGSACEAGELYTALVEGRNDEDMARIISFYDYLEIQPLGNNRFLADTGRVRDNDALIELNRTVANLGRKHGKPVVATCDVHFMDMKDEVFRRILMAGQGYEDADRQAPLFFRTTGEMLAEFSYLGPETAHQVVVDNTNLIADSIEDIIPIPDGTFPPKIEGAEDDIRRLAEGRAHGIYGDPLPDIVRERLDKELNSIIKNGFAVMYIIAQKLAAKSLNDGYLVGSRGSVGSSFVANMVGITEVNSLQPHYICTDCKYTEFYLDGSVECGFDLPAKDCPRCGKPLDRDGYDIPFETFLGFDGDKEPDIDLNFSGEYQATAHKYTEELFGEGHVFRAGTISTIAEKTAYGFVRDYLDKHGMAAGNAEINRLVKGCTGVKKTTGQHPGGIMVVPRDKEIYDFCPIQHPADDTDSGTITTHFDFNFLHGRILKLDILGHDVPTIIRMLEDITGVDARSIHMGESRTMGIFSGTGPLGVSREDICSEVGTFGIPEFGTSFVRQMLVETKPKVFSELIRISGLSHGTDVWINNTQELIRNGTATLSQAICIRDDIMLYLLHKGLEPKTAFKITEDVRKGKGVREEYEQAMLEKSVPTWYIESCKKIKYMFPKAHAAAYVMMAFRIAWYKVYYPEAFYATYFTVRADEFDADSMTGGKEAVRRKMAEIGQKLNGGAGTHDRTDKSENGVTQKDKNLLTLLEVANEMYARGIMLLKVDIYKSDAVKFLVEAEGIRPPFLALQGLGIAAAQNIAEARSKGEFLSVEDMRIKARISKAVVEILQRHGCFAGMPETSQIGLF